MQENTTNLAKFKIKYHQMPSIVSFQEARLPEKESSIANIGVHIHKNCLSRCFVPTAKKTSASKARLSTRLCDAVTKVLYYSI